MNYRNKHIAAFTIWEVLVTMLIISMIVVFSYKAFLLASKTISIAQQKNETLEALMRFERDLFQIAEDSEFAIKTERGIEFGPEETTFITITDTMICLEDIQNGTEQKYKLLSVSLDYLDESTLLSAMSFRISKDGIIHNIYYKKTYPSRILLNR